MTLTSREEKWMIDYQNGDDKALSLIYTAFRRPLYAFVYRYSSDEELSIDIVQDTFVKLQRYKQTFDPEKGKLASFLFQIAYRLMITKLNRRNKWQRLMPFLAPEPRETFPQSDKMTVREAVLVLPDTQRAVIILFYYHDIPQEDVARILGIPTGTVKSRLHTAIEKLKRALEVDDHESGSV